MRENTPHIFIIDDSELQLIQLEKMLTEEGFRVQSFLEGGLLLTALKKTRPDLIISDIEMPSLNGFELLKLVRQNFTLPFFLVSASSDTDIYQQLGETKVEAFLQKPFQREYLIQKIATELNLKPAANIPTKL